MPTFDFVAWIFINPVSVINPISHIVSQALKNVNVLYQATWVVPKKGWGRQSLLASLWIQIPTRSYPGKTFAVCVYIYISAYIYIYIKSEKQKCCLGYVCLDLG